MSFTHPTRAHCLPGSTCTILPRRHSNTRCFYSCVFYFFLRSVHIVIFEPRAPCGSLWSKKKKRKESARGVCVCDRGRLRVRFVYISSLFVHIWPETQKHPVFSRLWDECAGDHTENNCGNCKKFFLGCQRRCEGAGVERVLKQPWNKNK